jgi:hypothetical protein
MIAQSAARSPRKRRSRLDSHYSRGLRSAMFGKPSPHIDREAVGAMTGWADERVTAASPDGSVVTLAVQRTDGIPQTTSGQALSTAPRRAPAAPDQVLRRLQTTPPGTTSTTPSSSRRASSQVGPEPRETPPATTRAHLRALRTLRLDRNRARRRLPAGRLSRPATRRADPPARARAAETGGRGRPRPDRRPCGGFPLRSPRRAPARRSGPPRGR